jgi:hypothetical protein
LVEEVHKYKYWNLTIYFWLMKALLTKKNQFKEEKSKIIYIYIYKESIRFCWKINWVYEGFDCNENLFLSQFRL